MEPDGGSEETPKVNVPRHEALSAQMTEIWWLGVRHRKRQTEQGARSGMEYHDKLHAVKRHSSGFPYGRLDKQSAVQTTRKRRERSKLSLTYTYMSDLTKSRNKPHVTPDFPSRWSAHPLPSLPNALASGCATQRELSPDPGGKKCHALTTPRRRSSGLPGNGANLCAASFAKHGVRELGKGGGRLPRSGGHVSS